MCDHLCLDRLPMESRAYIANGWFCFNVMLWLITLVVCHDRVYIKSSIHTEWLVLMCCAAPDVCHERVLLKSSVYMGNGWP